MAEHSKYNHGKVLRSKDETLQLPDLMVLSNNLKGQGYSAEEMFTLDAIVRKIADAMQGTDFYDEYMEALNVVNLDIAEKGINNQQAVMFLRDQATSPIMRAHLGEPAPDALLSTNEWSWVEKRWRSRENFAGDDDNRERILRITRVLKGALGYRITADKQIEVEGDEQAQPLLKEAGS